MGMCVCVLSRLCFHPSHLFLYHWDSYIMFMFLSLDKVSLNLQNPKDIFRVFVVLFLSYCTEGMPWTSVNNKWIFSSNPGIHGRAHTHTYNPSWSLSNFPCALNHRKKLSGRVSALTLVANRIDCRLDDWVLTFRWFNIALLQQGWWEDDDNKDSKH